MTAISIWASRFWEFVLSLQSSLFGSHGTRNRFVEKRCACCGINYFISSAEGARDEGICVMCFADVLAAEAKA